MPKPSFETHQLIMRGKGAAGDAPRKNAGEPEPPSVPVIWSS